MKKNLVIILALGLALGLVALAVGFGPKYITAFQANSQANALVVADSFGQLADGVYQGHYSIQMVKASVIVTVTHGTIVAIELLEHEHSNGHSGQGVIDEVLKEQSLQVDLVTGSTISSKVILKAIEAALTN